MTKTTSSLYRYPGLLSPVLFPLNWLVGSMFYAYIYIDIGVCISSNSLHLCHIYEQYCVWDHLKELESMPLMRSMHLSKFVASMVSFFGLSLAVLKVVDFADPRQLTLKRIAHFKMLFEAIFEFSDELVWNIFTRIAVTPEYESLRSGINFFVSKYVVSGKNSAAASKFKIAKKALNNIEGILK